MNQRFLTSLFFLILFISAKSINYSVIPAPVILDAKEGCFKLDNTIKIYLSNEFKNVFGLFESSLLDNYKIKLENTSKKKSSIEIVFDSKIENEAYTLEVTTNKIIIKAGKAGGFYAIQTLRQLIQKSTTNTYIIPNVYIKDYPRFSHRGLMLDVGRYFYPVEQLKSYINLMSSFKFNILHLHFTEDAGWRIEIKKYPELTKKAAWRNSTQHAGVQDNIPHGGFYTQEEIKELVKYASDREITIIPEIEMPGHAMAALSVYPKLSCTGGPFAIPVQWGIKDDIFCAGNEKTFEFLEDVLTEISALFPSKLIHIGGDEAPKMRWHECLKCQSRIKEEGLKDEHELQSYFIRRIEKFLNSKGKNIIGWDEILEGGVAPKATVMSWRGEAGGIAAASQNHNVIMAPNNYMYFDYWQSKDQSIEPFGPTWTSHTITIDDVYNYEPYPSELPVEKYKYIIGVQANLWMENIHSYSHLEYMTYPRAIALSEVSWSQKERKSLDDFRRRLMITLNDLEENQINYRIPEPFGWDDIKIEKNNAVLDLTIPVKNSKILYTTDGSDPLIKGVLYKEKIIIPINNTINLKCVVQLSSGKTSGTYTIKKSL